MSSLRRYALGASSPISVLLLWELAARFEIIDAIFFPPPTQILGRLFQLLTLHALFWEHLWASVFRLIAGSAIAIPTGITLGIAVSLIPSVRLALMPLIALTYPVPKLAIFPILLIIFGPGDASKIAIIAIGVFYLVLLNTAHGVRAISDLGYLEVVKVYKIPFWKKMYRVVITGSASHILTGIKTGLGYGLVMVVAGEFTVSKTGLGVFMWNAWDQFQIVDVYAGLMVLSFFGILIFFACDFLIYRSTFRVGTMKQTNQVVE